MNVERLSNRIKILMLTGAILDAIIAPLMLFPSARTYIFGEPEIMQTNLYEFAMRMVAAFILSWTLLLFWGARKPLERRGIIPILVLMLLTLALAEIGSVISGVLPLEKFILMWFIYLVLIPSFSYYYHMANKVLQHERI